MATNYTKEYQLCQWEEEDQVNRLEFNQDNSRIEAGFMDLLEKLTDMKGEITSSLGVLEGQITQANLNLQAMEDSVSNVESSLSEVSSIANSANSLASSAYSSSNPIMEYGVYTGTGSAQDFSLGMYAKFLLIFSSIHTQQYFALYNAKTVDKDSTLTASMPSVSLYNRFFVVASQCNLVGETYVYLAFR